MSGWRTAARRQANSFFHEDIIQLRLRPCVVPAHGTFTAWVQLDPDQPSTALALQVNNLANQFLIG